MYIKLNNNLIIVDSLDDNQNFKENFETIRSKLGLCPQKNILYDNMSIEEHLTMIATIRGVPSSQITKEVQNTIMRIGLSQESGKLAGSLSDTSKRKLSLGISFIGGARFIFLDQPTLGGNLLPIAILFII